MDTFKHEGRTDNDVCQLFLIKTGKILKSMKEEQIFQPKNTHHKNYFCKKNRTYFNRHVYMQIKIILKKSK